MLSSLRYWFSLTPGHRQFLVRQTLLRAKRRWVFLCWRRIGLVSARFYQSLCELDAMHPGIAEEFTESDAQVLSDRREPVVICEACGLPIEEVQ